MSLLHFLRVIEEVLPVPARSDAAKRRKRTLTIESLERRSVLAVLADQLVEPVPLEIPTAGDVVQESALPFPVPVVPTPAENLFDPGESPPGGETPTDDPIDPPVLQPPVITSLQSHRDGDWVWLTGSVSDADGPVAGLIVYFTIGTDSTVVFTAVVQADGTFATMTYPIPAGTQVNAYTIDVDGLYSNIASCTV